MSCFVLTNASLFDGCSSQLRKGINLRVAQGIIDNISEAPIPLQSQDIGIDVGGKTLMPGLIDAHFHCNSPSFDIAAIDQMHGSQLAQYARRYLEDTLMRGFTTVRDAGGADYGLVQAIESGLIKGPRLLIAGKALSQTGGHGDMRSATSINAELINRQHQIGIIKEGAIADLIVMMAIHSRIFVSYWMQRAGLW